MPANLVADHVENPRHRIGRRIDNINVAIAIDVPVVRIEIVIAHDWRRESANGRVTVGRAEDITSNNVQSDKLRQCNVFAWPRAIL